MSDNNPVVRRAPDPREVRVAELEAQLQQRDALIAQRQQQLADLKQRLLNWSVRPSAKRRRWRGSGGKRNANDRAQNSTGPVQVCARPTPAQVTETKEQPSAACPECGGPVTDVKDHEQFAVDIPPSSRG